MFWNFRVIMPYSIKLQAPVNGVAPLSPNIIGTILEYTCSHQKLTVDMQLYALIKWSGI